MHIQLIVVVAPDGRIVCTPVDVHHMGQGVIAATSLDHLQSSNLTSSQFLAHPCVHTM